MNQYCLYYQAHVPPKQCGIFVALMRSFEHVCFDRTFDVATSIFEFFVPADQQDEFLEFMQFCTNKNLIAQFKGLPNRLKES